jgi:NodT family efflux transporter outer membrane factor (OMF) lipoprotein
MRKPLVLLSTVALGACAVGPNYKPPAPLPAAEIGTFRSMVLGTSAAAPAEEWWRLYDDPALDGLVRRALTANTDLRVARANLLRAQAALRETKSDRLPSGEVSAGANYSNTNATGQGGGSTQWSFNGAATIGWELDLFGRISRSIEAARGDAQAVEAARDAVALTVAAETARSYVDACALAEAVTVAKQSAGIAERELTIQQARERAGAGMRLDVERSATQLANIRATLPTLEGQRQASLFELAALLGETPSGVPAEAEACAKAPRPVAEIPVGDGRGLLARRPDVREAERKLAAETARIGVATAELYPSISLGGSGNFFRNDQVRGSDQFSFSVGPLISWNWGALFAGRSHVEQAEASAHAALATFDGTVLTALKEAEQALTRYAAEGRRNAQLAEAARHAQAAYDLAERRQRAGSISFLELLDTQRDLLAARSALAGSTQQLGSYRVDLFKALGSGWQVAEQAAPKP